MQKQRSSIYLALTAVSSACVIAISLLVYLFPEATTSAANAALSWITTNLGFAFLWIVLLILVFLAWMTCSKYGDIRLGTEQREFSKPQVFAMIFCASFGASAMYWCFTEVMHYCAAPPFGIEAGSAEAYEWGLAYNFFHWGPSAWAIYAVFALPIVFSFYIKKGKEFKLSAACDAIFDGKLPKIVCKLIDIVFMVSCFAVACISLGLSVPMISACVAALLGIEASFLLNVIIIVGISVIFTITSYLGLGKGMTFLSSLNMYVFIVFLCLIVLVTGVIFTLDSSTNALGLMLNNYLRMSLWTDPITKSGFPQDWTIFYWAYWLTFGPTMGVFIARIMKGYTIRDMVVLVLGAGSIGSIIMQGITQNFVIKLDMSGTVDAMGMVSAGQGNQFIVEALRTLPFPDIALLLFTVVTILFMATTLDSNSLTLAVAATRRLDKNGDPSPMFRLYWCLLLAVLPLVLTLIDVELDTIKTIANVIAIPLCIVVLFMNIAMVRKMSGMFKGMNRKDIVERYRLQETEPADAEQERNPL